MEQKKSGGNKLIIIIAAVVVALLIAVVVLLVLLLTKKSAPATEVLNPEAVALGAPALTYESSAVAINEESLQDAVDALVTKVEDGQMELNMKVTASSTDGQHFSCMLSNDEENNYDMYMAIYEDAEFSKQILLTGLLRPGQCIEEFKSDYKLEPGQYECYLVYTQIEDDHATIHAQVVVTITLSVTEA